MTAFLAKTRESLAAARPWARWRTLAPLTAAASTLLLFAAAAPSASASCGDWLADPAHAMQQQAASSSTPAEAPVRIGTQRPTGKPPCSGPLCRQTPGAPAPPVPVTTSLRVEKLTIAARSPASDPVARQFGRARESDARADRGFPLRVEHPPRV